MKQTGQASQPPTYLTKDVNDTDKVRAGQTGEL